MHHTLQVLPWTPLALRPLVT